ncbi:MAG: thiamine-phosphate kinase [Candidatus Lokiarchaeota archaeon]|nr:thiamine-phosphate kinase [Candidatus Lokiarchaeota archaeon]
MKKVSDIGERGLIKIISKILGGLGNEELSGEDDAVAIRLTDPSLLVINNDMLVSTTDIPTQMTLIQAGRKAVIMTVSDVLVKGAIPKWAVVSLGIPENLPLEDDGGFKGIISGLKQGFEEHDVQYLGGDLNETKEIIISCTIFGEAPYGVIPRSGAKPNDLIITTGKLGATGCGFSILMKNIDPPKISPEHKKQFIHSVLNPSTPVQYAIDLKRNNWVNASCDSSDGILATIKEICSASNTGAKLQWNQFPLENGFNEYIRATELDPLDLVFNAGEEFLHLYVIPANKFKEIKAHFLKKRMDFHELGYITSNPMEIILEKNGTRVNLSKLTGYEHLKKKQKE